MEPFKLFDTSVKIIFFLSIIFFVIFLILLIIHYNVTPLSFLSFLKTNLSEVTSETNNYKSQTISTTEWLKGTGDDKKLIFDTLVNDNFNKNAFTLSFDCYLMRTYKSTDVPRVLFYFGANNNSITRNSDLQETKIEEETETHKNVLDSAGSRTYTITSENEPKLLSSENSMIPTVFPDTNFIIYIDPIKNDMKFGVFINDKTAARKQYLEILPILKNIPVEVPFQITFILTETFAEIYMNKQLHTTYKIGKQYLEQFPQTFNPANTSFPFTPSSVGSNLYGPIDFIGDTVRVGNIQYVNMPLTSEQVRTVTNTLNPPIFFTKS